MFSSYASFPCRSICNVNNVTGVSNTAEKYTTSPDPKFSLWTFDEYFNIPGHSAY